ncbi:hypothetical protein L6164_009953 [Bauhinia variegata]|uniref:Uncharacterized protein n=1 Tax=Bauhinia variegata TaxID=167791 RepID=A0ACB9PLS6_BAUVA|nr:hypothetical protein L6164_009953 [Bauhinia variegata]
MESSSRHPRFRFRDHREIQVPVQSEPNSDFSSVSSGPDSESEIESMTGKGIKHFCSELLELKVEASEDLQKNILANYSAFVRMLEDVKGVEIELLQLKEYFVTHKRLVNNLISHLFPKILEQDTIYQTLEVHTDVLSSFPSELEVHINDVSEKMDIFLSENRIDEALALLESSDEYYQSIQFKDPSPHSAITLYDSLISESKSLLTLKLTKIAEDPKTSASDLRKALAGLCRLGDSQVAVHLLLQYYHSRIITETHNLQWSESPSNGTYIRRLAKFVFSMISQAASSFVILCGETSLYASELMLWACEETKSFNICLEKYLKCISDISGGLSTAVEAIQFAVSYCSLLENQKLMLRPYMVKHLCPSMEEVLCRHIDHFKKVIAIFLASDTWVLERYLVSGILGGGCSSQAVGQQPEYCVLTNSGRKFLTLLQAIIEDISPLVALQMGVPVISGLMNLYSEYIIILERALACETNETEKDSSRVKLAESLPRHVSILANLSTLAQFLSTMISRIFRGTGHLDSQLTEDPSVACQQKELDDFLLFIEESSIKLRYKFCEQFILTVLSSYSSHELILFIHNNDQDNLMPSDVFQILFLELRKLEQLTEETVLEVDWLMGLLRELIEAIFIWISKNKEIHRTAKENMSLESDDSKQFILDVQFLVEIGLFGDYFSNDPLLLLTFMKSTFLSAGIDPFRVVNEDEWAIKAATETIQKLLDIEKTIFLAEEPVIIEVLRENQFANRVDFNEDDISSSENGLDPEEAEVAKYESEVDTAAETVLLNVESSPQEEPLELLQRKGDYVDESTSSLRQSTTQSEKSESADEAGAELDKLQIVDNCDLLAPKSSMDELGENPKATKSKSDESTIDKQVDKTNMPANEVALVDDSVGIENQDIGFNTPNR